MRLHTAGALMGVSLPVAYLIKKHVDWEKSPESKQRMLIHQATFWSTVVIAVKLIHDTFWKYRQAAPWLKMTRLIGAGLLPVLGFEGGMLAARKLLPKKPPVRPAFPSPMQRRVYIPSYLKQNSRIL